MISVTNVPKEEKLIRTHGELKIKVHIYRSMWPPFYGFQHFLSPSAIINVVSHAKCKMSSGKDNVHTVTTQN